MRAFGILLIDGLSIMEEHVLAHLHSAVVGIPIVGGSAGDDLDFSKTFVYSNGSFKSNRAVFTLIITSLPFDTFKTQHFKPTEKKLVITEANPKKRIVYEINGNPAAEEYASIVGMTVDELSPTVFSNHPVMLKIGSEYYVRSLQKVNDDGSLTFYCAIDEGLVLTLAEGVELCSNLTISLEHVSRKLSNSDISADCTCFEG